MSERAVWVPTTGPTGGKVPVGVAETLRLTFPAHARPFRDRAVTEGGIRDSLRVASPPSDRRDGMLGLRA